VIAIALVALAVLFVLVLVIVERKRVEQQRALVASLLAMAGEFAQGNGADE
jgi:hypothetical protein